MAGYKELSNRELLKLIEMYNKYIQDANDTNRYEEGFMPVCIDEFYFNDYLETLGEIKTK